MSKEGPWVRFFPSDWLAGTRGLSASETGVYITLVAMMYERGAPIPHEPTRLARLCGTSAGSLKATVSMLIEGGKLEMSEGGLWNARVEKEASHRREKSQQAAESADSRWQKDKQKQRDVDADAMRTQYERNASQKPVPDVAAKEQQPRAWLSDRLIEAAGSRGGCHPNLVTSIAQILAYLDKGYDLERDVLPVIRAKASPEIRKWTYFGTVIEANARERAAIAPKPSPASEDWAGRLSVLAEGTWVPAWGPKPGEPGCRVPSELLRSRAAA